MSGIRGTRAAFLFFTATSVGVPSANFLNTWTLSLVNTGSSVRPMLALAISMNGKLDVPWHVF